jgi:ribosomal protein L37AE/L43A
MTEKELFCKVCQEITTHKWDGEEWVCQTCSDSVLDEGEAQSDEDTIAEEEFDA